VLLFICPFVPYLYCVLTDNRPAFSVTDVCNAYFMVYVTSTLCVHYLVNSAQFLSMLSKQSLSVIFSTL
jgi:hypothetical protein